MTTTDKPNDGLGLGFVTTMVQMLINMYFERYRGAANGIMFAGSTASAFIFPRLLLFFGDTFGFRGSLFLFGAILMNMIAVSLAFREPPWVEKHRISSGKDVQELRWPPQFNYDSKGQTNLYAAKVILRNIRVVLKCTITYVLAVTWLAFSFNYDIFVSTTLDFAMDKGVSLEDGVSFITYTSITDLVGRLVLPILADSKHLQQSTLMILTYFFMGLCALTLSFCEHYWALLTACLCFALFLGCAITMQSVVMAEYLGTDKLAAGYAVLGAFCGPILLGKAPFVGFFRDYLGSYNEMFWVLGSFSFVVTILWILVYLVERKKARKWKPNHT